MKSAREGKKEKGRRDEGEAEQCVWKCFKKRRNVKGGRDGINNSVPCWVKVSEKDVGVVRRALNVTISLDIDEGQKGGHLSPNCTALHCTALFCSVAYYTILYYTILRNAILCCIVL